MGGLCLRVRCANGGEELGGMEETGDTLPSVLMEDMEKTHALGLDPPLALIQHTSGGDTPALRVDPTQSRWVGRETLPSQEGGGVRGWGWGPAWCPHGL